MVELKPYLTLIFGVATCLFSPPGKSFSSCLDVNENDKFIPYAGVYIDSINKFNLKGGVSFIIDKNLYAESNENETSYNHGYANLAFIDYLISENSDAISLGWGRYFGSAVYRIGVSKVTEDSDSFEGIEGTVSVFSYSLKIGVYDKERSNDTKYLLGVGFEF